MKDSIYYNLYNLYSNASDKNVCTKQFTSKSQDPNVWGPQFWYMLHNGAAHYPNNPSLMCKQAMEGFINGIPVMLPCVECAMHANSFIKSVDIDKVVRNRNNLFEFFFMFHNEVNKRLGKPLLPLNQVKNMYGI